MTTDVVKINAKDYGLEETKAREIESVFVPMMDKMKELENEYNQLVVKEVCPEVCQEAKALRTKYVKVRTATAAIHKEAKAFYLAGGRFVDGWKNAQLYASQGIENKLKAIEEHYENIEKERKLKLKKERLAKIAPFEMDCEHVDLGEMTEDVWQNFFAGAKATFEAKKEAERKAEEERIAAEKAEAERIEKQRIENERLKKEAAEREAQIKTELEKAARERKRMENKVKAEKQKAEAEQKEKERLAKKLKDIVECPKCGHKFNHTEKAAS